MNQRPTEFEQMWWVADDREKDTLEELRLRAGLAWRCEALDERGRECLWHNYPTDSKCGGCGATRP